MKSKLEIQPSHRELFEGVEYLVEATDFERHTLWKENHQFVDWNQHSMGNGPTLGYLGISPTCISCTFATLNGKKVMFYHSTSLIVDYGMIDQWLEHWQKEFPAIKGQCDATNFGHCLQALNG